MTTHPATYTTKKTAYTTARRTTTRKTTTTKRTTAKKKTTTKKSSGKKFVYNDPDDFLDYDEAEDYYDEC